MSKQKPGCLLGHVLHIPWVLQGGKNLSRVAHLSFIYDESLRVRLSMSCRCGCRMCSRHTLDSLLELVCLEELPCPFARQVSIWAHDFCLSGTLFILTTVTYYNFSELLVWLSGKWFLQKCKWHWTNCVCLTKCTLHFVIYGIITHFKYKWQYTMIVWQWQRYSFNDIS